MVKSMIRNNEDFSSKSRSIKNLVHNVNKNVTPSSAHNSIINTDKRVNDSNIQSNNNFATPSDIFNWSNPSELTQRTDTCINENIITPSPTLYVGSQINILQSKTTEMEYNYRTSSSPIT